MREMPGCLPGTLDRLALEALEHRGLIEAEWGESDNRRRARYCRLTQSGRRRLKNDVASWNRPADAIAAALVPTPGEV
jgi:DNA-binding PadR family transcriptional regulator